MLLSLQGSMAVGKTTALRYLEKVAPYLTISYEDNQDVITEIHRQKWDKNNFEDYIKIQRLWIAHEIARWKRYQQASHCVMDFGAEEILFYTLHYPQTIGEEWPVADALEEELQALEACMPQRILFLEASEETLRRHKEADRSRSRNFFDHYVTHFLPLKRQWFSQRNNVDILVVDDLSPEEVAQRVKDWCDEWFAQENTIS